MTRRGRRALIALGVLVGAWWLSGVVVLFLLTGRPRPPFEEPVPASEVGRFEVLRIPTRDGEELGAWFADSPDREAEDGSAERVAVLLLHGYSGSRTWALPRMQAYVAHGHPILSLTLRAHGDSTGERVDYGLSSSNDVIAGIEFLEARLPGRPILIHGFSMGSAAAVFAAAELGDRIFAYVLDSPFETISIATRNRTRRVLIQPLADIAWLALVAAAPLRLDIDELRLIDTVRDIPGNTPVLVLSGELDTHALPSEARAIAAAIGTNAKVVSIPGATHDRLPETASSHYWSIVWTFIRECGVDDIPLADDDAARR